VIWFFTKIGKKWIDLRVCLNFVFGVENDEWSVIMKHVFERIAKAIGEKNAKVSADHSLF